MSQYIISLNRKKASAHHVNLCGGKASNLIKLKRFGFRVSSGFVITTNAFDQFFYKSLPHFSQEEYPFDPENCKKISKQIMSLDFPPKFIHLIMKNFHKINGKVAVRSSMVGEDSSFKSFAGLLDTYLNIEKNQLLPAIKKCFASLFQDNLFQYMDRKSKVPEVSEQNTLSMAVIVQKMVDAKAAGVAFSADPFNGRQCVIIEAAQGLGESVVRGKVNSDRYLLDESGELIEIKACFPNKPVLKRKQIYQLAYTVKEIASKMGSPQDIEWAWDGNEFFFLQTRPITSLTGKHIYSNKLVSDMAPGLVKPLFWSTNASSFTTNVFGQIFNELIGPNSIDFCRITKKIHSRVYTDVTFFGELLHRIGLPSNFFETIIREEKAERTRPSLNIKLMWNLLYRITPFIWKYSRKANEIERFIKKQNLELDFFRNADWSDIPVKEKLKSFEHLIELHKKAQWNIFIAALNMSIRNKMMTKMVKKHAPDVQSNDLIRGLMGLKGLEPNRQIQKLSVKVRNLEEKVIHQLIDKNDREIRQTLTKTDQGKKIISEVDSFLEKYGFLSPNSTNFTETPWIEDPTIIWSAIAAAALNPKKTFDRHVIKVRLQAKDQVLKKLNWCQKIFFNRLLDSTIRYINLREQVSMLLSEDSYQMRRITLSLADHYIKDGLFKEKDDIYFLSFNELKKLAENNFKTTELKKIIELRKSELEEDSRLELDSIICGDQITPCYKIPLKKQTYLTGICGSSGFIHGYAYVVQDPSEVHKLLNENDILVVPYIHVGWTPLFSTVGGIVAETGGQLSHASIVAREYGLPAVVSVKNAMRLIKNNQPITLDANKGKIYMKQLITS